MQGSRGEGRVSRGLDTPPPFFLGKIEVYLIYIVKLLKRHVGLGTSPLRKSGSAYKALSLSLL